MNPINAMTFNTFTLSEKFFPLPFYPGFRKFCHEPKQSLMVHHPAIKIIVDVDVKNGQTVLVLSYRNESSITIRVLAARTLPLEMILHSG
jgi:hypothetical protein